MEQNPISWMDGKSFMLGEKGEREREKFWLEWIERAAVVIIEKVNIAARMKNEGNLW